MQVSAMWFKRKKKKSSPECVWNMGEKGGKPIFLGSSVWSSLYWFYPHHEFSHMLNQAKNSDLDHEFAL